MKAKKIYISITLIFLLCITVKIRGQKVILVNNSKMANAILLSTEGIPISAQWEIGRTMDDNSGVTIRHSIHQGNGSNMNPNAKLPFQLLVALEDCSVKEDIPGTSIKNAIIKPWESTWAEAMGLTADSNSKMEEKGALETAADIIKRGCRGYITTITGYANVPRWRLPTQRELQLIYLLKDAIWDAANVAGRSTSAGTTVGGITYPTTKPAPLTGAYWSSTEVDDTHAYYLDFDSKSISSGARPKTDKYKVRCVADFY